MALSKYHRKSARLYSISCLKRVGCSTETLSLLQQHEQQTSEKASGKQSTAGELCGKQAPAEALQMERQEKPFAEHHKVILQTIRCSPNNCTMNSHCGYRSDTAVLVPLHLPIRNE